MEKDKVWLCHRDCECAVTGCDTPDCFKTTSLSSFDAELSKETMLSSAHMPGKGHLALY